MRLVIEAGYSKPTLLQKKVIPLILKGKNVAVEAGEQTGKTASYLLPLLHRIKRSRPGIKILILTATVESARKAIKFYKIFSNKKLTRLSAVVLGEEAEAKREYRLLQRTPDIIIGTSQRIIDHIRRDNLTFQHLQALVIDAPAAELLEYFNPDVHFILSKLPRKVQKIYFSAEPIGGNDLDQIIKRPVVINRNDWHMDMTPPDHFYFRPQNEAAKQSLLLRLCLARRNSPLFIFCDSALKARNLEAMLRSYHIKAAAFNSLLSERDKQQFFDNFQNKLITVAIFQHSLELSQINFSEVAWIINYDVETHLQKQLKHIILNTQDNIEVISFLQNDMVSEVRKLQEMDKLNTKQGTIPGDEEVLKGLIEGMITHIKEVENPQELTNLKKIIRKNVSFFDRAYFMAYLFKQNLAAQGDVLASSAPEDGDTARLFINIGKKRKVFPRDLIGLFCSSLDIDKANLKEIKILDNYSFVEIEKGLAQKAISLLNGKDFKGRKIAVNFARKKEKRRTGSYRGRSRED